MSIQLKNLQQSVLSSIFGSEIPEDPALGLYRELCRGSVTETLELIYPHTQMIYDSSSRHSMLSWSELAESFVDQYPPDDWRINWNVRKFPQFLANLGGIKDWLVELADFEWAHYLARSGRDSNEEDWINPTLVLRTYEYPVTSWFSAFEKNEGMLEDFEASQLEFPSTLAIFRNMENFQIKILQVQPAAYELLQNWLDGGDPQTTAKIFAEQLGQSSQFVLKQMKPLLKTLIAEGALLHEERKSTRNFLS